MSDESKLENDHHLQLRAEMSELRELVGNLVSLIDIKAQPNNPKFRTCHVWKETCKNKLLTTKGAKQEDPREACSTQCMQARQATTA